MPKPLPHLIIICGPTASGKSAWAWHLAQTLNGELVNADARQIYRGMDIGTNKEKDIPIHLVDIKDPSASFSVGEYQQLAYKTIDDIIARGHLPIVVGGTGLYIRAITDGIHFPPADTNPIIRERVEAMTLDEVHQELHKHDPAFFVRSDAHNTQRARRALEIFLTTGKSQSAWMQGGTPRYTCHLFAPDVPRDQLYARINARVHAMIAAGWQDEVRALIARNKNDLCQLPNYPALPETRTTQLSHYSSPPAEPSREARFGSAEDPAPPDTSHLPPPKSHLPHPPSLTGIGYQELIEVERGTLSLPTAITRIQARTRAYARRQLTWFNALPTLTWCKSYEELEKCVRIAVSL